jgi:hypothetical protein
MVRTHVNNSVPYCTLHVPCRMIINLRFFVARSQRPREYHSLTGIEPIADPRIALQHLDMPALSASTQPQREEQALQRQTRPDTPPATGPSHNLLSAPPHLPRGSGSRVPQSALHVKTVPHINPEHPTAPQGGVSHNISNTVHGNMTQMITSYGESGAC